MNDTCQFCTFRVGQLLLGIEVDKVQEVARHRELTRVPLAPPGISGLMNLRGQIVPALDLRFRLGLAAAPAGQLALHVMVSSPRGVVSLQIDQIEQVVTLERDSIKPPPPTLGAELRTLVKGVSARKDQLLLLLDEVAITN